MKLSYIFILAVTGACLLTSQPPLWPQGKDEKKSAAGAGIEGTWILLTQENNGDLMPALPPVLPPAMGAFGDGSPIVWKITKDKIESNVAAPKSARHFSDLEIDPGGKLGWLNSYPLDKDGKRTPNLMSPGIYFVKDDYLMICEGGGDKPERPMKFSTSPKQKQNVWLHVFRRSPAKVLVNGALKKF